jgi:hypothetical protein
MLSYRFVARALVRAASTLVSTLVPGGEISSRPYETLYLVEGTRGFSRVFFAVYRFLAK